MEGKTGYILHKRKGDQDSVITFEDSVSLMTHLNAMMRFTEWEIVAIFKK